MDSPEWFRPDGRVFIIAEAGINHNGDMRLARRMIDAAADADADAVKFQTYQTERLLVRNAPKAEYQLQTTGGQESQFDMLKRVELSRDQHLEVIAYCQKKGITFISTPFDEESADLLEALDVPLFKIPSGEITNFPFLEHVARKRRPMIISTGMSFLGEVEAAVRVTQEAGCPALALLHCVTNYPAVFSDVNLHAIRTMTQAFGVPVGYSDHTLGIEVAVAAVALGAQIIEKHFTLDRVLPGPDHKASLEPEELALLVRSIRNVKDALGDGLKRPASSEMSNREIVRKSLVFDSALPAGTIITDKMIRAKRPGTGLAPGYLKEVVGRKLLCDAGADTPVTREILGRSE